MAVLSSAHRCSRIGEEARFCKGGVQFRYRFRPVILRRPPTGPRREHPTRPSSRQTEVPAPAANFHPRAVQQSATERWLALFVVVVVVVVVVRRQKKRKPPNRRHLIIIVETVTMSLSDRQRSGGSLHEIYVL